MTGLLEGNIHGLTGAHSQVKSLDELNPNLREVIGMILEDGAPRLGAKFVGPQSVAVA